MPATETRALDVVIWGTYDLGKPRTRLMINAIRKSGAVVTEIHAAVWDKTSDKGNVGKTELAKQILKWLVSYPHLVWRLMKAPRPDVFVIGYMGHLDVLVLKPIAMFMKVPIVWDAFLSLHDTVVNDRKLLSSRHPLAFVLKLWEWLSCRASDRIVLDTEAQADFFCRTYSLTQGRVTSAFVGAEANIFQPAMQRPPNTKPQVLFYGQFIPLHGVETILDAARLSTDQDIQWTLIGTGQTAKYFAENLENDPIENLRWIEWVPYQELADYIASADVCLGVFGDSEKAGRVIPNKVFQCLAAGRPIVTRNGPGISELVPSSAPGIVLVNPNDPKALLQAINQLIADRPYAENLHQDLQSRFSDDALAKRWGEILAEAVEK